MEKPDITSANISDRQEMIDIRNRHNSDPNKHWCISHPFEDEDVSTEDGNVYFVARLQNTMVGYMWMNSEDSFCREHKGAEIFLVVDKGFRKKEVGSELRDHAVRHATEETRFRSLFAKVKAANIGANALFKGWKKKDGNNGAFYSLEIGI